ncbi:MAG: hypothetical protein ACM3U2_11885 [Deltaproteobacteria bacterium]
MYLETSLLPPNDRGEIDYDSASACDIMWDSMKTRVVNGKVTLRCIAHHHWHAQLG